MVSSNNMRVDARANRDRILSVARDALAADPTTSLNAIAKISGVGPGTLYRHFPSREALVLGVFRQEVDALVVLAPKLLAKYSPLKAFRIWCVSVSKFGKRKHGIADMLHAVISDKDFQATYWPMLDAVRQLMNACERARVIRPGVDPEDFLTLLSFLTQLPPNKAGEVRVKRLLALVFRCVGVDETAWQKQ